MPKLSDFKPSSDEKKVDEELTERIEGMMEDSFYEFALDSLDRIYNYVQKTSSIKDWMITVLDKLENYKEREEEK